MLADLSRAPTVRCSVCMDSGVVVRADTTWCRARACPACDAGPECPHCRGSGYRVGYDDYGAPYSARCACEQAAAGHRTVLYDRACVPARYADATLGNFQTRIEGVRYPGRVRTLTSLSAMLRGFCLSTGEGACLTGAVGVGKTHLVAAVIRKLTLSDGIGCRFVEFSHLLTTIKQAYNSDGSEQEILEPLITVPVLVVDELGKGLRTQWQREMLDLLVGQRYARRDSVTFYTTNYSDRPNPDFGHVTLEQRVGPRIYSRIAHRCEMLAVDGPDFRRLRH